TTIIGLHAWPGGAIAGTTITGLRAWPGGARAGTTITGLRTWPRGARAGTTITRLPEEQPLPVAATPTADSPGYIPEFGPNGDPEEDEEEEDPKEDPADSTVVTLPAVDHVSSEEVTEPLPQIPSPLLPIPSPPGSPTYIEISKSCLPLRKRLRFASPTPSQEVGESSAAGAARLDVSPGRLMSKELGYSITDTWDELVGASEEIAPTTLQGVNQRVIDLSIIVEQETIIMYGMMEEAQDDRSQLRG
nr:hypothetical protein [Tanacetum cinerariifolium]